MQQDGAHIVRLVEQPAPTITVADVILGSLGIVGLMTLTAVVLGALLGWWFIVRSRRHGVQQAPPPSIHPLNPAPPPRN